MATQSVEFRAATGLTITAKLFSAGNDTQIASVSATEATNRKGTYTAAFTSVAAGEYILIALDATPIPVASWWVTLTNTTATFQVYEKSDSLTIADAVWDEPYAGHTTAGSFGKIMDLLRKANLTIDGTVSSAITPTTLTFSSNVSATTSAYAHAVLLFVSGPLTGENSPIISYNNTNGVFVLEEPLTAAPSNGDEFVVIAGSHVHAIADIAAGVLASINGSGARTVTITVDDGTNPLQNALVRVTNGGDTYVVGTNVSGVAVFNLDDATWIVSITKGGYSFAGASLVVDGTEAVTYSMSLVVITPSSVDKVTGYWTVLDETGSAAASVVVTIKARQPLRGGAGLIHDAGERTATSNGSGLVQFTNLIPGWRYAVVANDDYVADFVVPADAVTSVELGSIVARLP